MNKLLELFDKFTEMIPPNLLRAIRLGALVFWFGMAGIAVYLAWGYGVDHAPASGQELHLADIQEKIQIEKNLKKRAHVIVPPLNDLPGEDVQTPEVDRRLRSGLEGMIETDKERMPGQELPPFLSEKNALVYPESEYIPENDRGVGGVREKVHDEVTGLIDNNGTSGADERDREDEKSTKSSSDDAGERIKGLLKENIKENRSREPSLLPVR